MRNGSIPYWFVCNFDFDNYFLDYYSKSVNLGLSYDMKNITYMGLSIFSLMKEYINYNYNYYNWEINYDMDLLEDKLVYYNYEYYNKLVNNKIRYIRFRRDVIEESCILYVKKHTVKIDTINSDRLIHCYKECLRFSNVWDKYLSNYGKMYILDIDLSKNIDYNLSKLGRFINREIKAVEFNYELDERLDLLKKKLKDLIRN